MKEMRTEKMLAATASAGLLLLFSSFLFDGFSGAPSWALIAAVLTLVFLSSSRGERKLAAKTKKILSAVVFSLLMPIVLVVCADSLYFDGFQYTTVDGMPVDLRVTATDDATSGSSVTPDANGVINVTATQGGTCDSKTVTVTLQNAGECSIEFTLSYTKMTCSSPSGTTVSLEPSSGNSIILTLASGGNDNKNNSAKGTITITNIKFKAGGENQKTTFQIGDHGAYTVDGVAIHEEQSFVKANTEPYELCAYPDEGYELYAWVSQKMGLVFEDTIVVVPGDGIVDTIKPLFRKPGAAIYGIKDTENYYACLDEAVEAAVGNSGTIVVVGDGTAYHSNGSSKFDITIPSGVTLLVPFDLNYNCYTATPGYDEFGWTSPTVYRKLTLAEGANITVEGAISVSARLSAKMGYAGAPTKKYGQIEMNTGSSIVVSEGGNLYAWGYITGNGEVTIKDGATVYESFQVVDWRGGTATTSMLDNPKKVFPMTQYYVQNVEASMVLEAGAVEKCCLVADISTVQQVVVPFIGRSGCMFNLTSGTVTKRYDGSTDRILLDIAGDLSVSATTIPLVMSYKIIVGNYVLPIGNNYSLNVNSGTLDFETSASLLAGSELNIAEGAKVTVTNGAKLFVYDETEWKSGVYIYNAGTNYHRPVRYAVSKNCTRTAANIIDTKIVVNGTLDASAGYLYTTESGANIYSTGNGVVILQAADSSHTLYEAVQTGTNISYNEISITGAQLKNLDGSYATTEAGGEYYYCFTHGVWGKDGHSDTISTKDPTCTAVGTVTATCVDGNSRKVKDIPKLSHIWSVQTHKDNEYTCECEYGCGIDVVLNVAYRLDDYLWFNGSTTESFLVDELDGVTVSDNIQTVLIKDKGIRYFVKAIPADEIPDDLTFTIYIDGGEATFTVRLADYVTDDEELKQALLNYGTAAKDYFEKTYGETGTGNPVSGGHGLISQGTADMASKPDETTSVGIATVGANIYFDEAMRLAVKYRLSKTDSNIVTVGDEDYTIVQIGLLVKELDSNWTMTEALTTSTDGCTAYLTYNTTNKTVTSGGVENRPNADFKGEAAANLKTFSLTGMITFDLKSKDYAKGFALRTYVVLQDKAGNYHCAYGKQYGYGLEAYINATYSPNATVGTADMSFNNLLEQAWALAQAAK